MSNVYIRPDSQRQVIPYSSAYRKTAYKLIAVAIDEAVHSTRMNTKVKAGVVHEAYQVCNALRTTSA